MEIYFNPYPGTAETEEEGLRLAVEVADALIRLKRCCTKVSLTPKMAQTESDLPLSRFVLFRNENFGLAIGNIMFKTGNTEREKLRSLLDSFSRGKIIDDNELNDVDNWIVSNIDAPAAILELAAKKGAIALTIPTKPEWQVDVFEFNDRDEILHNLWGQENISAIINHCNETIKNIPERFSIQFDAKFCPGSINSAPDTMLWDRFGLFNAMEKAKKRDYRPDNDLIKFTKGIDKTKYGALMELRSIGPAHRMFFVHRKGCSPEILIGGFYQKNESLSQNKSIQNAKKCIDNYTED